MRNFSKIISLFLVLCMACAIPSFASAAEQKVIRTKNLTTLQAQLKQVLNEELKIRKRIAANSAAIIQLDILLKEEGLAVQKEQIEADKQRLRDDYVRLSGDKK